MNALDSGFVFARVAVAPDARKVRRISHRDRRRCIGMRAQLVDLRKVDRYWSIKLAFGPK